MGVTVANGLPRPATPSYMKESTAKSQLTSLKGQKDKIKLRRASLRLCLYETMGHSAE